MFSFDISYLYEEKDLENLDQIIFDITNEYTSCKWYASDCGPSLELKLSRNHGFNIDNVDDLQEIIRRIGETDKLFIDFVYYSASPAAGDLKDSEIFMEIYRSKNFLSHATGDFVAMYTVQINNLSGVYQQLHQLCIANETKNL
jgi:hypothetical protein